jgi:hypothetical protein
MDDERASKAGYRPNLRFRTDLTTYLARVAITRLVVFIYFAHFIITVS